MADDSGTAVLDAPVDKTPVADAGASTEAPAAVSGTPAPDAAAVAAAQATEKAAADAKADTKATADAKAAAVPDKYDLKLPETPTLDPTALERTAAFARSQGLSNAAAQAVLELANTEAASAFQAKHDAFLADYSPGDPTKQIAPGKEWTRMQDEWTNASLADPEIGAGKPEQLEAKVKLAQRAYEHFGPPELRELLRTTGYGSHPLMVRTFAAVGAAMAEGTFAVAGAESGRATADLYTLYPSMKPKE